MDRLFHESDRLYYTIARGCDLSESAYWIMYAIEEEGGRIAQSELCRKYAYSRQTVNSAVKVLEARGYVEQGFSQGSRKSKDVSFTLAGKVFSQNNIVPAMQAEQSAYLALEPEEREELLRLIEKYTRAIEAQINAAQGEDA